MLITQIPLWSMERDVGGPALTQMLKWFSAAGHTIHLVTPKLPYVSQQDLKRGVVLHTFPHTFYGIMKRRRRIGWLFDTVSWLVFQRRAERIGRALLEQKQIDVIYGYDVWGMPVARKLADRYHLPMVSRFQGTRMNLFVDAPFRDLRLFKYFKGFKTPADLYIMTNDGSQGDRLLQRFGVEATKLRHWRNGVDIVCPPTEEQGVLKESFGVQPGEFMLLTLCRLVPEKGVQHAIRAMSRVRQRFEGVKLVVVGTGYYRDALEGLARELGAADAVIFTGGLERERVAEAYGAANVFISMYDHSNVGNPLLEAMSCGKPVITLDVGATSEVVENGVNGILLSPGREDMLGETIVELLTDDARRSALSSGARDWARANLTTWQERIDMEISEVSKLVEGWRPSG